MPNRVKVIDIELSRPLESLSGLEGYQSLQGLVRLHGTPLGYIQLPVVSGECSAKAIAQAILPHYTWKMSHQLVLNRLAVLDDQSWELESLLQLPSPTYGGALPSVTVAFCPGSNPDVDVANLRDCLNALQQLDYPHLEVLVVENAPQSDALQQLVQTHYPNFRYLCDSHEGLNWARNLAIQSSQSEIIAFTDAHALVEPGWVRALAATFAESPEVMTVTGLVVPHEIETEAQYLFEVGYGFGRGFDRQWQRLDHSKPLNWTDLGTMRLGTGANMAYRRCVFDKVGKFDCALDLPSVTEMGGDLDMFCRVILAGQTLVYEPTAIVRYRAPQDENELRSQLIRQIIGFYAYLTAGLIAYPELRWQFATLRLWKFGRLLMSLLRPYQLPRHLIWSELQACWKWGRYAQARRIVGQTADLDGKTSVQQRQPVQAVHPSSDAKKLMAVRTVDLHQPLFALTDVVDYQWVRVFVTHHQATVGYVDIQNAGQLVSAACLRQAMADQLTLELLAIPHDQDTNEAWTTIQSGLIQYLTPMTPKRKLAPLSLPPEVSVTVVITTCDRPHDLERCLNHLLAQKTSRSVEIIVADNRPASGLTPAVVTQFPGVKLVNEIRQGSAYGRNAAIAVSTGDIIVTIDDDVTVPSDWLEKLLAPLARPEVMAVMGNVLPLELETPAQLLFEKDRGGLGQGFKPFEVDHNWLASFEHRSPPTWELGVSANAAFRASIFNHPQIGLMNEVLGSGTPAGGGEENYLVYKILKAGFTLVYEPSAYAWHKHRREIPALYRQIYGQMKSSTSYNLTLWLCDQDRRGLQQLIVELPRYFNRRLYERLRGWHDTPWLLLWQEIAGYLAGYWGYWRSCQRVKKQGRSTPYVPPQHRVPDRETGFLPLTPQPSTPEAHVY